MLMRVFAIFLFLFMTQNVFAECGEDEPCRERRLNLEAIKTFHMDSVFSVRSSISSESLTKLSDCRKRFRATKRQAQKYFEETWIINNRQWHYAVSISPCVFKGTLQTKSGKKYKWEFGEGGDGMIWRTDKKNDDSFHFLYCSECVEDLIK